MRVEKKKLRIIHRLAFLVPAQRQFSYAPQMPSSSSSQGVLRRAFPGRPRPTTIRTLLGRAGWGVCRGPPCRAGEMGTGPYLRLPPSAW